MDGQGDKKKLHLMNWSEVIKYEFNGGLGLGILENENCALLAKWWTRFQEENEALWYRLITFKFSQEKWGWWPKQGPSYHRFIIWRAILLLGMNLM